MSTKRKPLSSKKPEDYVKRKYTKRAASADSNSANLDNEASDDKDMEQKIVESENIENTSTSNEPEKKEVSEQEHPVKPEKEIQNNKQFNPFKEDVIHREYAESKQADNSIPQQDIEEPVFSAPSFEESEINASEEEQEASNPFDSFQNSGMNDLNGKDKKMASGMLVKVVLSGYQFARDALSKGLKVNEIKLSELYKKGDIDPAMQLNLGGQILSVPQFFEIYNDNVNTLYKRDLEWEAEITPPLERMFARKNYGITDDNYVYFLGAKKILQDGMGFFQLKKSLKDTLEILREATKVEKEKVEALKKQETKK